MNQHTFYSCNSGNILKVELNICVQITHGGCTEQYVLVRVESSLVEPGLDAVQSPVVPERCLCPLRQVGNGFQTLRRNEGSKQCNEEALYEHALTQLQVYMYAYSLLMRANKLETVAVHDES